MIIKIVYFKNEPNNQANRDSGHYCCLLFKIEICACVRRVLTEVLEKILSFPKGQV